MEDPTFEVCEREAFMSLLAARNALLFHSSRESLPGANSDDLFIIPMINESYGKMKNEDLSNHGVFAAEKFYQCADREKLSVSKDPDGAAVCLGRHDILFFLDAGRREGQTQEQAKARTKSILKRDLTSTYPSALIDELTPMVYRTNSADENYALRRFVFETCLFPTEWKAWWNSFNAEKIK
ncbi:hypothetical protein [Pendulispora albinea]|uniref:Uncharacterized protein n=1 Tax=Pendulispora albinea TaxID=2741071 RepID=A0ABZ2M2J7_9BACT